MTAAACLPHGMLCRHMGSHRRLEEARERALAAADAASREGLALN